MATDSPDGKEGSFNKDFLNNLSGTARTPSEIAGVYGSFNQEILTHVSRTFEKADTTLKELPVFNKNI